MDSARERIAHNIRRYRNASGLSVEEVGAAIGKSGKTISAWEVGRGQPDADMTIALCQVLGIELLELYGEKPDANEREERLLNHYRAMNSVGQDTLLAIANTLAALFPKD